MLAILRLLRSSLRTPSLYRRPTAFAMEEHKVGEKRPADDAPVTAKQDEPAGEEKATVTEASSDEPQVKRVRIGGNDGADGASKTTNDRSKGNEGDDAGNHEGREAEDADNEGGSRLPKRKVSIFFGYCGIGYSGLQINPGVKTIEGDIFEAFCKAGAVSKENAVNPTKVGLQRSARTDRGVHAAGNLLTLKLILNPPGIPEDGLVSHVNSLLPPIIRIWGLTRVQNSFNARTSCDSRLYEYMLPTYVFLPPKPGSAMHEMLARITAQPDGPTAEAAEKTPGVPTREELLDHPFWKEQGLDKSFKEDVTAKKRWRICKDQLERVRKIFSQYEGSHNFHNYTVGKEFRDRSAHRFMKKLSISDPKIINGTEWLSIKFHGQSFMLHQIRKMIGLLVLVGRTNTPASLVPETYGPARIHVPKAPGLGLLLEEPFFAAYNRRVAQSNARIDNRSRGKGGKAPASGEDEDAKRELVDFKKYEAEMEQFKQTFIYDRIMKEEEETDEFAKWLNYLEVFVGPDFEYLNPKGVIPPPSILKVGEQRRAPGGQPKGSQTDLAAAIPGKGADGLAEEDREEIRGESDDEEELLRGGNQAELEG